MGLDWMELVRLGAIRQDWALCGDQNLLAYLLAHTRTVNCLISTFLTKCGRLAVFTGAGGTAHRE